MFLLTVYNRYGQSRQVCGQSEKETLDSLRHWMIARSRDGKNPLHISGLRVRNVIICWDSKYNKWCIRWDKSTSGYFEWGEAMWAFVDACSHHIYEAVQ